MVARSRKGGIAALVITLLLLMPLSAVPALGQEVGEEGDFAIREEYRIELNEVGDASITDTIVYDEGWFEEYGFIFEENPNLLTRRYRADSNVGEVEDFEVDIDSAEATVIVTFETPGLAYRLSDGWTLFGYGNYELVDEGDDEITLAAAWTITNEFSLFEPMDLEEELTIDLPDGATGAEFDQASGAIKYDLEYKAKGNALADNKILFTIIFALLMALSLVLLLFLFTRRGGERVVAQAAAAGMPAAPAQASPQAQVTSAGDKAAPSPRFCKKCGHSRGGPDERFCRKCGAPHE